MVYVARNIGELTYIRIDTLPPIVQAVLLLTPTSVRLLHVRPLDHFVRPLISSESSIARELVAHGIRACVDPLSLLAIEEGVVRKFCRKVFAS